MVAIIRSFAPIYYLTDQESLAPEKKRGKSTFLLTTDEFEIDRKPDLPDINDAPLIHSSINGRDIISGLLKTIYSSFV